MRDRKLFVQWLLLNAFAAAVMVALGVSLGGRVHGAAAVAVPAIFAVFLYGTAVGARLCWLAAEVGDPDLVGHGFRLYLLHRAHNLSFLAWVCQIMGILSTVLGFWVLLSGQSGAQTAELATRIQSGAGVALAGTFVGIVASLVLTLEHRLVEHELGHGLIGD